jgi:hypothetical protein
MLQSRPETPGRAARGSTIFRAPGERVRAKMGEAVVGYGSCFKVLRPKTQGLFNPAADGEPQGMCQSRRASRQHPVDQRQSFLSRHRSAKGENGGGVWN